MRAYYNEIEPYAAQWLRNLIAENLIAQGDVDTRSIVDVQPDDLKGYTQCHFFAGLGGWSYALRRAGWADDKPVWTGSCPCQPFSVAGKGNGESDERHLWPEFRRLISKCSPATVFGEQVASKLGRGWLSGVRTDLETLGYAVGAADLCAAGVGAPHIRQRLWWVADSEEFGRREGCAHTSRSDEGVGEEGSRLGSSDDSCSGGMADTDNERCAGKHALLQRPNAGRGAANSVEATGSCAGSGGMADTDRRGFDGRSAPTGIRQRSASGTAECGVSSWMGDANDARPQRHGRSERQHDAQGWEGSERHGSTPSVWSNAVWLPCSDGKARRIEPGLEPLANGVPARVGKLRAYGNAIVPEAAEAFIRACCND